MLNYALTFQSDSQALTKLGSEAAHQDTSRDLFGEVMEPPRMGIPRSGAIQEQERGRDIGSAEIGNHEVITERRLVPGRSSTGQFLFPSRGQMPQYPIDSVDRSIFWAR